MNKSVIFLFVIFFFPTLFQSSAQTKEEKKTYIPWSNGKLVIDEGSHYLKHENGTPFFWLGDTGWYLPARLNRDEAEYYIDQCHQKGFNVIQVMVMNNIPAINTYGKWALPNNYDFEKIDKSGEYGYWDHMDYILKTAEKKGIYIGMVCVWGGPVQQGKMNVEEARKYGKFLANRYKNQPNIVWIMGGDIKGDVKPEVWNSLATAIKSIDKNHLMTFHPRGRTMSGTWFNNEAWLDFNMFQSGHRRYGQRMGDGEYPIEENTEEDNWRFVERSLALNPTKPVIDGEPSYENIPQGLHDPNEVLWKDCDVRRYAYWSVFAGAFGHTYGNNSIMQMKKDGIGGAYGAKEPWYEALNDPGINQMKYVKNLILTFPFFDRIPDQTVIAGNNGIRYDRLIATRGKDYLLVYNYTNRPMNIDLTKISGQKKKVWLYSPINGSLEYLGDFDNKIIRFTDDSGYRWGNDKVLIAIDSTKDYLNINWQELPDAQEKWNK
jgi:hypothetical protein